MPTRTLRDYAINLLYIHLLESIGSVDTECNPTFFVSG